MIIYGYDLNQLKRALKILGLLFKSQVYQKHK